MIITSTNIFSWDKCCTVPLLKTFQVSNILGKPGGSLEVMPKHLSRIEVMTLTEPHQEAYFLVEAILLLIFSHVLGRCAVASPKFSWVSNWGQMGLYSPDNLGIIELIVSMIMDFWQQSRPKPSDSHCFSTLHLEHLHSGFNKYMKMHSCLCVIGLSQRWKVTNYIYSRYCNWVAFLCTCTFLSNFFNL